MFNQRQLNDNELKFITKQINSTKNLLLSTFLVLVVIVAGSAILIYSDLGESNFGINIAFGTIILLLSGIYWAVVGYSKHKVNPQVFKSSGVFSRIYVQYGKNGRYHDAINGHFVKIPWHWRKYLKSQKGPIDYEYIIRDDAFDMGENAFYYVVSVNNELSLDYEINNGLYKAKPLSFIHLVSLLIVFPVALVFTMSSGWDNLFRVSELFKNETDLVVLNTVIDLEQITSPNYIKIQQAWVYQYKREYDYSGDYYVVSKAERDRIFNNPSSNFYYRYYFPARAFTKPDKEALIKQFKSNPLRNQGVFKNISDSIWKISLEREFKRKEVEYKNRLSRAKKADSILEVLKPKTTILKLDEDCFDLPEKQEYSIRKSLRKPIAFYGFYNPKEQNIISFEEQNRKLKQLRASVSPSIISLLVFIIALFSIGKVIYNSVLKKKLVEKQLNINTGDPRLKK